MRHTGLGTGKNGANEEEKMPWKKRPRMVNNAEKGENWSSMDSDLGRETQSQRCESGGHSTWQTFLSWPNNFVMG
eukprot:CAMPEP_0174307816 /NCGR_PEP_ID=MMETSP0810-20121108/1356_1 /TAXON_ID=73025 ORGANISM="Eutreptiella gymnastica-like, Strain CCMP1594" /NCGR_SAMPLE_ID=MMETSP0810 /ASSEMBLY_ACC=CAM_ASM_000659 /LENGTH=74 /DNA_ID=CAMNT_0015414963 /DNA_START=82 /DNA_END=306 /DNA_ORIENTATION=-